MTRNEWLALAWYIGTGALTAALKPRTQQELDAMPKWLAGLLRTLGAFGVDGPNAVQGLSILFRRNSTAAQDWRNTLAPQAPDDTLPTLPPLKAPPSLHSGEFPAQIPPPPKVPDEV